MRKYLILMNWIRSVWEGDEACSWEGERLDNRSSHQVVANVQTNPVNDELGRQLFKKWNKIMQKNSPSTCQCRYYHGSAQTRHLQSLRRPCDRRETLLKMNLRVFAREGKFPWPVRSLMKNCVSGITRAIECTNQRSKWRMNSFVLHTRMVPSLRIVGEWCFQNVRNTSRVESGLAIP